MFLLNYFFEILYNTLKICLYIFVPFGILTFCIQYVSKIVTNRLLKFFEYKKLVYFTAIGVAVHEIGHAFFCILFGHKIDKFVLFKYEADRLGYVAHRYNPRNLYHRIGNFFIGTGPIWFGFLTIVILSEILLPKEVFSLSSENNDIFFKFMYGILKPAFWFNPLSYLWIYLTTSIVLNISLSKADMKGAFDGLVTLFVLIFILNLVLYRHIDISNFISDTVLKICIFTLPVAAIIFFFLLVFSLILSLRNK